MNREEQPPAEALGPYRLVERLAAGGMGEVWRAWDGRLKRPVAVKHVLPQVLEQPGARERFRREAEAGARLTHPAVVQIYDLVESPEGDWLVMELVVGKTLRELLSAGPLDLRSALQWASEIAGGLGAAHAQGVLHRDLKAGNVMITTAGHAKILDFGIARSLSPAEPGQGPGQEMTLSQSGAVLGTSYAMSPEQALGLPLDSRSDLFSLGSLLYEMLTGEAPFRASSAAATLARVCSYRPLPARRLRAEIPVEVSTLIERLLEKEPSARPRDAAEVAALLQEAATGLPALRSPEGAAPPARADAAPGPPPEETTFAAGSPRRPTGFELSSATFPRRRRVFLRSAGVLVGVLLLVLVLAWQGGRLAAPYRAAGPHELLQQGQAALRRYDKPGNLDAAIADFRQVIDRVPRHAAAHAALARAYQLKFLGQKDRMWLNQALPLAEQAVALNEYLASARVSRGQVYTSLGRLDEALREIETAIQLEPGNADAQYALGNLHEARTQLDLAEAAYRRAIALRPDDRQFYDDLGALYLRTGRLAPAIAAFQSSIRLAPDGPLGYRNLGSAYYQQGDLAQAAAQIQKALEIEPQPSLYSALGTFYFAQGLYPQAAQAYEHALELPGGANDYRIWANLGDSCRLLPDGARAREAYSRALQLLADPLRAAPRDATLLSRRALYLAMRGDCGPALAVTGETERLAQADATAWSRLVVAHEVCGRREPAVAALERALHNGFPLVEVQRDPELLALRSDVRYHRLLVRLAPASTAP